MIIEGVILAAGLSSRVPEYKMTLMIQGKTVLDLAIASMLPYCERVIVVTGHRSDDVEDICRKYDSVETIHNKDYELGMLTSVKSGFAALNCDLFFMMPGDYPCIQPEAYEKLLEAEGDIRIPSIKQKRGHPLLMKKSLADEFLKDDSCDNLRSFINKRTITYVDVEDDGVLKDIDAIEDYKEILRRFKN